METIELSRVVPAVFADNPPVRSQVWGGEVAIVRGDCCLIEAASGTGKSSLCGFLYGYRRDYAGAIRFDGEDIRTFGVKRWSEVRRRMLAMTFQGLRLFPELSALDNVRLKNDLTGFRSEAWIGELFAALGIADKRDEPLERLSFGQRQRVAFVRMLCQPADFLILDEPMSHLDERNAAVMAELLREERRQRGVGIVITSVGKRLPMDYDKILTL